MSKPIRRRTFLRAAAGVTAASTLGFPYIARAAGPLVINSYGGSFEKFMRKEIIPPFVKETGIEIIDLVNKTTFPRHALASGLPVGVVQRLHVPAITRKLLNCIDSIR